LSYSCFFWRGQHAELLWLMGLNVRSARSALLATVAVVGFGSIAHAIDKPMNAAPLAPAINWTGCYVGANIGGGWGRDKWVSVNSPTDVGDPRYSGVLGGGQVGCDHQSGPWVVGLAGMFDWGSLKGSSIDPFSPTFNANTKVSSFDTATARLGYAVDRALYYVDGGAAWVHNTRFYTPYVVGNQNASNTRAGWTVGIGLEYMIAPNWSWKIEYNHSDFGKANFVPFTGGSTTTQNIDTVLLGLNYRFSTGTGLFSAKN
jgi:outer membrane immunogenic protein